MSEDAIRNAESQVQAILKAVVVDARGSAPASRAVGEDPQAWTDAGALLPPYDPEALCLLLEHSSSLRQNIDAYCTNIDGFGHRFEPTLDLDADDVDARIADAMLLEQLAARECGELDERAPLRPTDEEVTARLAEVLQISRLEKARLESFFNGCCIDSSFVDLRRRTRQDLETTGNAYWEILRDARGRVARLVYVPSHTIRLLPLDAAPVEIDERIRVSPISYDTISTPRRLRRYVQLIGTERVYFRSFRDPRLVSRRTGRVFEDLDALVEIDPSDGPATEIVHFSIPSPRSPYGIPRWIGTLLSVLGSRAAEEVNHAYFTNKSVPPLAVIVSGGHLAADSIPRLERFVEENLRGAGNFHRILILEAESAAGSSQAKIELKPLTSAQLQDALFQGYDERNVDKVGAAFRLPRLLRGDSRDFNRSTAESAMRLAEEQVFQPERDQFDFAVDRLLADMGVRFWRFKSQSPVTRDPERMTGMIERLVKAGVLVPEEARQLAGDVFNHEFRSIDADWARQPIALTLAGIDGGSAGPAAVTDALLLPAERLAMARDYHDGGVERAPADNESDG